MPQQRHLSCSLSQGRVKNSASCLRLPHACYSLVPQEEEDTTVVGQSWPPLLPPSLHYHAAATPPGAQQQNIAPAFHAYHSYSLACPAATCSAPHGNYKRYSMVYSLICLFSAMYHNLMQACHLLPEREQWGARRARHAPHCRRAPHTARARARRLPRLPAYQAPALLSSSHYSPATAYMLPPQDQGHGKPHSATSRLL